MLMVGTDPVEVERLFGGGELNCPDCRGVLRGWGHARERVVGGVGVVRPRRSRCPACARTHVLLPISMLLRRADGVEVIGAALLAGAAGQGFRRIAAVLGRAECTVRGWLRRFTVRAQGWRQSFTVLVDALDPEVGPVVARGSVFADAVEVIGVAAAAAARRFGPRPAWQFASRVSGGLLLGPVGSGSGVGQHELTLIGAG